MKFQVIKFSDVLWAGRLLVLIFDETLICLEERRSMGKIHMLTCRHIHMTSHDLSKAFERLVRTEGFYSKA